MTDVLTVDEVMALPPPLDEEAELEAWRSGGHEVVTAEPLRAVEVAQAFIERASTAGRRLDKLQVQKLTFYAQMVSIAETGEPLFDERIQAWILGPAVWEIHSQGVAEGNTVVAIRGITSESVHDHPDALRIIDEVWGKLGTSSGLELMRRSHDLDGPWTEVRGDLPSDAPSQREITYEVMLRHAGRFSIGRMES